MKNIFIIFFAISFCFVSCGKKSAEQEDAHVHDDRTVQGDHNDSTKQKDVMPMDSTMKENPADTLAHSDSHYH